jgi:diguanylate cyclase (GGDEF)-like protein
MKRSVTSSRNVDPSAWPEKLSPLVAAALDSPRAGSVIFGPDLRVRYATSALEPLLGLKLLDLANGAELVSSIGKSHWIGPDSGAQLILRLQRAVTCEEIDNAPENLSSADGARKIRVETRRIARHCWMSTFEDITEQRRAEAHLHELALHDPLTGLGNRAHFEQRLSAALAGSPKSGPAILLLDLDRFKAVNDTLGHSAGDTLLRLIGDRLQSVVRESDVTVRMGGDEFAILIATAPSPAELEARAHLIIDLLQRTCLISGQVVNVGASIGIAVAPKDGETTARLLQSADLALYQAKESGRSRFVFFDTLMDERAEARRNLEFDLRKALPLRQIEVHYKPRVDIATQTLLGHQAIVRWRHPVRGLMEWAEFAPLAEQIGLTVQIGDWTLRTVCRDAMLWTDQISVSVSTFRSQFESGHLLNSVKRVLAESSVAACKLEIAITEEILLPNEGGVLATLHELRELGVRIAMDGFGTGYASLRQLASFPFDRVNINRALLADGSGNPRHRAIVRAITSLGASLGISTMAEGIETPAELDRIHSDGCASLQGYMPTRGVPPGELPGLVASLEAQVRTSGVQLRRDNEHRRL